MPPKNGEPTCYRCKHLKIFNAANVDGDDDTYAKCGLGLWRENKRNGRAILLRSVRANNELHSQVAKACGKFDGVGSR